MGVAAIAPSRIHPIDIAAQIALLADVARGGVYVGLARGAWLADHGIAENRPALESIREAVDVIRYMLSGGEGGYPGALYPLAGHVRAPYPLPDQAIPILIGTWGRQLAGLAGEIADEVKIGGSANPAIVPVMQAYIAAGEERVGRPPGTVGVVMGAVCVVDEDRDRARQAARRAVALYLPVVAGLDPTLAIEPELISRLDACVRTGDWATAAGLIADDVLDRFAFSGSAADITRAGQPIIRGRCPPRGVRYTARPPTGGRHTDPGTEVIPALHASWR